MIVRATIDFKIDEDVIRRATKGSGESSKEWIEHHAAQLEIMKKLVDEFSKCLTITLYDKVMSETDIKDYRFVDAENGSLILEL